MIYWLLKMREKKFPRFLPTDSSEHPIVKNHKIVLNPSLKQDKMRVYEFYCLQMCIVINLPLEQFSVHSVKDGLCVCVR